MDQSLGMGLGMLKPKEKIRIRGGMERFGGEEADPAPPESKSFRV